jgi:hypothetical protein
MNEAPDLDLKALGGFIGSMQYFAMMGANVTDGIKYVMDNGYSWFVTDALAVIKCDPKIRAEPFLVVKLTRTGDKEADLTIDDGGKGTEPKVMYSQHYEYTDAKRDLKLYFADNVLMLASEY